MITANVLESEFLDFQAVQNCFKAICDYDIILQSNNAMLFVSHHDMYIFL